MTKGKGYLLPSGDATEDDLECCLVFYPARDEYRRALMGSLDYLATWIAWERDSEKRGQDAAASWKLANIQTWECCNMGYCDDLLTTLQALLAATRGLECCGPQDITDGRQYTDEIVDGVGDVPQNIIDAGYADDAADWDGFNDYKCMISHLAVDHVETFLREIAPHISDTGIVIGGIGVVGALVGAILTVAGLPLSAGIIIALGAAAAIWTWITSEGRQAVDDLADEIAANHDALACAIYEGDGVTESVDDFNDEVDALFTALNAVAIKAINIEPQLRAMYAGRYDQEDIAAKLEELGYDVLSYDCTCIEEDPPPSGYQLIHPPQADFSVAMDAGAVDNGSTYDEGTGIVVLDIENVSDQTLNFRAVLDTWNGVWGHKCNHHGFKVRFISESRPGGSNIYNIGQPPLQDHFPSAQVPIGSSWGGYNTSRHGGSLWNDWVNQYDYVENYNDGQVPNDFDFQTQVTSAPNEFGIYTITYKLWLITPI